MERIVQQPPAQQAQEKFSDLPTAETERSTFDMSHPWKGTTAVQKITPVLTMEILPGDTMSIQTTAFIRLATPLKPIMDGLTTDIHYFFCPNRLVWDNWQFFMGERKTITDDPTTVSIPQITVNLDVTQATGTLIDYFGLPLTNIGTDEISVSSLPFRCYTQIWNDWYRNENLVSAIDVPLDDGPDVVFIGNFANIRPRHKRADYFTRALPWPQKGDPVFLPLGTSAPVVGTGNLQPDWKIGGNTVQLANDGADFGDARWVGGATSEDTAEWSNTKLEADLTQATAATINDIRTAFQIQRLLERDARGGTRYISILLSHFNVQSPDFRLQRAEYIGGGSTRITINPVAATVATVEAPQGNLSSIGTGLLTGSMNHSFVEHGYLFAFISTRADLTYQNGLDRMWSRLTRYDFYWPALSHLGEQAIKVKELFLKNSSGDDDTWGYQERYAEYRYAPGRITGKFRSIDPQSLDVWHLASEYTTPPTLDEPFLYEAPPIDRIVAVPSEPDLLVDVWHKIHATRVMPVYAVPGMVDHF